MGYLMERFGMTMLRIKPGTCPECGVKHDPEQPHKQQSLAYQYKFYDQHGRWPTWVDALAHCPDDIKDFWCKALAERGIKIEVAQDADN